MGEPNRDRSTNWLAISLLGGAAAFVTLVPMIMWVTSRRLFNLDSASEWGDFFAGIAGPAALAVLAASFLLQRDELRYQLQELRDTRDTLAAQRLEMEASANAMKNLAKSSFDQYKIMLDQNALTEFKMMKEATTPSIMRFFHSHQNSAAISETTCFVYFFEFLNSYTKESFANLFMRWQENDQRVIENFSFIALAMGGYFAKYEDVDYENSQIWVTLEYKLYKKLLDLDFYELFRAANNRKSGI